MSAISLFLMLVGKFEFHSISVDPRHQDYSFEELRWRFYESHQQVGEKSEEELVVEERDPETETCDLIIDLILKSPPFQTYLPKLVRWSVSLFVCSVDSL
jgi:hypothetical protein